MATKLFQLLKTGISHAGLSNVTQNILGIINEQFAGEHPLVGPVVGHVQRNFELLQQSMLRKSSSEYTPAVHNGHTWQIDALIGLKHQIRGKLKQNSKPEVVKAARELKAAMVNSGVWKYKNFSHQHMSSFTANVIKELSAPKNHDLLAALGLVEAFDELIAAHGQYKSLETQRIDEWADDTTPRLAVARVRLLESVNTLVSVVGLGAVTDPAGFGAAAERIDTAVQLANAVTRSGQTRRENAVAAEQAEQAAASGRGSAAAGGGSQHATFPPQGSPATSVAPETNPVGPPTGKGASTA
jgi:hypothetical protein